MNLTAEIPGDPAGRGRRPVVPRAGGSGQYGHITKVELRRLLGKGARSELDGFLKA
jgi:hypothetical protein